MMPASSQHDMLEPKVPVEAPDGEDEPVLLIEPLEPPGPGWRLRGVELRPLLNIVSLALALLLIVVGAVAIHALTSGTRPGIRGTVQLAVSDGTEGWNPAGTAAAQDIAFAASAPALAYDCGAPTLSPSFTPVPIAVATSRDGGRTWHALPSPGTGVTCGLTINPTNALDVVLMVSPSSTFVSAPIALYRSGDGGQHWQRQPLPPRLGGQSGGAEYAWWAWSGGSLFLAPYFPGTAAYTDLAASVAGGPFAWVQEHGLFHGAAPGDSINLLLGTPNTIYAVLTSSQTSCVSACTRILASSDDGVSWSSYLPTFQGHPVNLLWADPDGRTLFGGYFDDPGEAAGKYVYSIDGGASWRPLTSLPRHSIASSIFSTPNGTFYAVLDTNPESPPGTILPGVYRLAPDTSTWTFVAPQIADGSGPVVVSWDATGHPLALWSNIHASIADGIQPGLQRHPA